MLWLWPLGRPDERRSTIVDGHLACRRVIGRLVARAGRFDIREAEEIVPTQRQAHQDPGSGGSVANRGPPQIASLTKAHHPMSRRIHIAVVLPTLHGGGAEFAARQWVRSLTRVGHIVTVYLYDRVQPDVSLPPGITIHRLSPWFGRVRPVALVVWLAKRIRVDRPDVILSVLTYTNVAVLITPRTVGRRKVPVVLSEHNMPSLLSIDARARDRLVFGSRAACTGGLRERSLCPTLSPAIWCQLIKYRRTGSSWFRTLS